jgi:hypothetical protein
MTISRQIQSALRDWINLGHWNDPRALTLTMKQYAWFDRPGGTDRSLIMLDRQIASANLRHFLSVLNRQTLGNLGRRQGKKLWAFPVLEGTASKHLHYHLVIDCPFASDPDNRFEALIRDAWLGTDWGDVQMKLTRSDDGWVHYMTKLRDKPDFADAIDWTNAYMSDVPPTVACHR